MGPDTGSAGPESQTPLGGLCGLARIIVLHFKVRQEVVRLATNQVLEVPRWLSFILHGRDGVSVALTRGHAAGLSTGDRQWRHFVLDSQYAVL